MNSSGEGLGDRGGGGGNWRAVCGLVLVQRLCLLHRSISMKGRNNVNSLLFCF